MAFSVSYTYNIVDKFSSKLKHIRRVQEKFTDTTRKARVELKNFGDKLTNLQSAVAGVGAVMAGRAVLDTFNDFQTSINQLSAVSMASTEELENFRNMALELGATTRFTGAQVAQGMVYLKMAGLETKYVLEAIPGMLDLASAGSLELGEAADIATNMLLQQGLAVSELTRVSDNLATVQTTSNTSILEAGEAMKNVLTTAAGLGFELEHTTAMIGSLANVGVKAGEAGTLLRNAMLRLVNPSKKATKTLKRLGIDMKNFITPAGKIKNFNELLTELQQRGATTGQIFKIFQERGGRAIMALMRVGAVGIERLTDLQKQGVKVGMAAEMARRRMAGIPGMILSFKSAIEALEIAFVDSGLAFYLMKIGEGITKFIRYMTKSHKTLLGFVGVFSALSIALIAVVGAVIILAPVFTALVNPVGATVLGVMALTSALAALGLKFRETRKESHSQSLSTQLLAKAFNPLLDTVSSFFNLFTPVNMKGFGIFSVLSVGVAQDIEYFMRIFKSYLELLTRLFTFLEEKKQSLFKPKIPRTKTVAEWEAIGKEQQKMRELQTIGGEYGETPEWLKGTIGEWEGKYTNTEFNVTGKIDVAAEKGTKVTSSDIQVNMPGNLGFNVAP